MAEEVKAPDQNATKSSIKFHEDDDDPRCRTCELSTRHSSLLFAAKSRHMLGRGGRPNQINGDGLPLLQNSLEHEEDSENTLFSIEDDDDDVPETSALEDSHPRSKPDHSVRFQDQVQVIAPPLRSTIESREAGASFTFVLV